MPHIRNLYIFILGVLLSYCGQMAGIAVAHRVSRQFFPSVYALCMSHDGKYAACGQYDDKVFVWQIKPLKLLGSYNVRNYHAEGSIEISAMAISANPTRLVLAFQDGSIVTLSLPDGKPISQESFQIRVAAPFHPVATRRAAGCPRHQIR